MGNPGTPHLWTADARLRKTLYDIIEQSKHGDRLSRLVIGFVVFVILVNLAAVVLESVPSLERRYHTLFLAIEVVSLAVFAVEYALRIYVAPEHEPYKHLTPMHARWRYMSSAAGLVDLFALIPFAFAFVLPEEAKIVLVLRMFRFLKLARYSRSVRSLLDTLNAERRALGGCMLIVAAATMVSATLMHAIEGHVQPDKVGTIPDAMWWAIVTIGTIGYGDVVPVTTLGKLLAAATIFAGILTIALPVGIIATAFADQIHRRDFIVTWGMVSRVPLFAGLTAGEIADVMQLLRAETRDAGTVITRRGDVADSMYFIAHGAVEIELPDGVRQLEEGQFFGEMAALRRARRTATVRAREYTSLLVLDAKDLHSLMERQPKIAERMKATIRTRLGRELISEKGDLLSEELLPPEAIVRRASTKTRPKGRRRTRA